MKKYMVANTFPVWPVLLLAVAAAQTNIDSNWREQKDKNKADTAADVNNAISESFLAPGTDIGKWREDKNKNRVTESDVAPPKSDENTFIRVKPCNLDSVVGVCVPYYLCDDNQRVITNGVNLIEERQGFGTYTNCTLNLLEICCILEKSSNSSELPSNTRPELDPVPQPTPRPTTRPTQRPTPRPAPTTPAPTPPARTTTRPPRPKPSFYPVTNVYEHEKSGNTPVSNGCGWSNPGALESDRQYSLSDDGNYAEFGKYPWLIIIMKRIDLNKPKILAGGVIIHPKAVLTSAHRVDGYNEDELVVRAGEYNIDEQIEFYPHQDRDVNKIVVHDDFLRIYLFNSAAVLFLSQSFSLADSPHIGIACLASQKPPSGTTCEYSGWEKKPGTTEVTSIPNKIDIPTLSKRQCETALRGTQLGNSFVMHPSWSCAGAKDKAQACAGNGGFPLVCPMPSYGQHRYTVYGLAVFGVHCNLPGVPGVYVDVSHFYTWVGKTLREEGLDPRSFDATRQYKLH